ncbi:MAG: lpbca thioredoxin [Parcubacteria group bacterium GW2011_GWA2_43_17]|nr:MAG: lpbca thioredoxin [Parcubacteria group bacterium GW2011_GWA2_43_17]OGY92898.1 MAG: thioredoxin [Candidatus Komeilibacteria bacterium RIFOXYA2_FULL_45_9]HAH04553.1 thioredoxin [Candidatus Komeilibacteria bacterium]HBR13280.1 thioredoxin [Candidatus Komeilibacteria bacterium]HBV02333.1 thioredoxin [Candidatus Komeilibacteria bacterium]
MSEVNFSDQNFEAEVLKSSTPVLVDFFATWCGPCQMQAPIIDELADEYKGKVKIGSLDVDQSQKTAGQFQVSSIPTLIMFKDGQEVERFLGLQAKSVLKDKLDSLV